MNTENFTEYTTYLRLVLNSGSKNADLVGMLFYKLFDFVENPTFFKTPSTELFEIDDLHRNLFDRNERLVEEYKYSTVPEIRFLAYFKTII